VRRRIESAGERQERYAQIAASIKEHEAQFGRLQSYARHLRARVDRIDAKGGSFGAVIAVAWKVVDVEEAARKQIAAIERERKSLMQFTDIALRAMGAPQLPGFETTTTTKEKAA
jgi:hypothetical protein